jgi:hypothetical protein
MPASAKGALSLRLKKASLFFSCFTAWMPVSSPAALNAAAILV